MFRILMDPWHFVGESKGLPCFDANEYESLENFIEFKIEEEG